MVPVNREAGRTSSEPEGGAAAATATSTAATAATAGEEKKKDEEGGPPGEEKPDPAEPKGDPDMAPVYLRSLLPVFTYVYQGTMLPSVR